MKKIDISQTITILANVGVIAGIAFLAVQINQNTKSARSSAYQDLVTEINHIAEINISSPEAFVLATGEIPLSNMSPEDSNKASSLIIMTIRYSDLAYFLWQQGIVSDERLDSALGMLQNICYPNYQELWSRVMRGNSIPEYRDLVDSRIEAC